MTLEEQVAALFTQVDLLTKKVNENKRLQWEDKVSGAGIQLQGPSTITREGNIMGVTVLPSEQGGFAALWLVQKDDGTMTVVQGPVKAVAAK